MIEARASPARLTEYVDRVSRLRLAAQDGVATFQLHAQNENGLHR
jgi:hypothetical protein